VTALDRPDFRTISEFRRRHLAALAELFVQVLALCRRAGLVGLGHVAVDGTKLRANASKHKAMSYARMGPAEADLAAEVEGWLAQAEGADAAEDAALGTGRRGDEMPAWMRDKQRRLQRIRAAKAELEAEARAAEAAKPDPGSKADGSPRQRRGRKPKHPPGVPKPTAQRNFTDPESRIMKGRDGFVQAYNAQAAVDAKAQVILAHHLTNNAADHDALGPLLDAVTGRGIRGYVATGRAKHPDGGEVQRRGPLVSAMRRRLRRAGRRSRYRLRKQVVEPVFGQIKGARGFWQFLLRGLEKVKHEWALICTAHNLTKLARAATG
jgi:hypothetical protein